MAAVVVVALVAVGLVLALLFSSIPPVGVAIDAPSAERIAGPLPPLPPVEPTIFTGDPPDLARISNAAVPIARDALVEPRPFRFSGSEADRSAAEACLTAALIFEAGDDPPGERAVAQVVLNRLRHPAFPKTVCGVIQQGSERRTGCQFTFTCDGALARVPSVATWQRSLAIAREALNGAVYKPVGTATHYHTDWVVPYWRSSLQKVAIVHTQIFYRWPGPWGSRNALVGALQPGERVDPRIARYAGLRPDFAGVPMVMEQAAQALPKALAVAGLSTAALNGNVVRLKDEDAGQFVLQLNPAATPGSFTITAFNLCGDKLECMVFGWTDAADIPRSLPVMPFMMRTLAFAYRKSNTLGIAQSYWDCRRFPRPLPAQCLKD